MRNRPRISRIIERLRGAVICGAALLALLSVAISAAAQNFRASLPPGTQLTKIDAARLASTSFAKDQPIVGTYFFYWYDVATKEHFIDHDGTDALTDHPADPNGYSYRSPQWHRRELLAMREAGLDFALPVYWGYPGDYESWSFVGLKALVEACRQLQRQGEKFPRIGLFYDTSTLQFNGAGVHADLATDAGKQWLYVSVRDFYLHLPAEFWATVEGRPLVWLYSAHFARRQDAAALDYVRGEFERDFGVAPYIVKEVSWQGRGDATYAWGAAIKPNLYDVAAVGPGYDHSAVPGRTPLVRDREHGEFYRRSWEWMLSRDPARRPAIAIVETWNEWHEGTDIAESKEYGRRYVELTRHYADMWRAKRRVERSGKYARAESVSIALAERLQSSGLELFDCEDGKTHAVTLKGKQARQTTKTQHGGRYIYFDVDDAFFFQDEGGVEVEVEYYDASPGPLVLEYDSSDAKAPHAGAFKARTVATQGGKGDWRTARVQLGDAAFSGRANGGDLRFSVPGGDAVLAGCTVRKFARGAKAAIQSR